jgi:hypothetical protein
VPSQSAAQLQPRKRRLQTKTHTHVQSARRWNRGADSDTRTSLAVEDATTQRRVAVQRRTVRLVKGTAKALCACACTIADMETQRAAHQRGDTPQDAVLRTTDVKCRMRRCRFCAFPGDVSSAFMMCSVPAPLAIRCGWAPFGLQFSSRGVARASHAAQHGDHPLRKPML